MYDKKDSIVKRIIGTRAIVKVYSREKLDELVECGIQPSRIVVDGEECKTVPTALYLEKGTKPWEGGDE